MNNNQFIKVCGSIIYHANGENFRIPEMCNLLTKDCNKSTVTNVIAKAVRLNMFVKIGTARNTCYKLSDHLYNDVFAYPQDKDKKYLNLEEVLKHHIELGKHKIEVEGKRTILTKKSDEMESPDHWREQFINDLFNYIDSDLKRRLDDMQVELDLVKEENVELRSENNDLRAQIEHAKEALGV